MESWEKEWEIDDMRTALRIMQLHMRQLDLLKEQDRRRFVTREEVCKLAESFSSCLDRSVRQIERMLECMERLSGCVSDLTDEVISMREKLGW